MNARFFYFLLLIPTLKACSAPPSSPGAGKGSSADSVLGLSDLDISLSDGGYAILWKKAQAVDQLSLLVKGRNEELSLKENISFPYLLPFSNDLVGGSVALKILLQGKEEQGEYVALPQDKEASGVADKIKISLDGGKYKLDWSNYPGVTENKILRKSLKETKEFPAVTSPSFLDISVEYSSDISFAVSSFYKDKWVLSDFFPAPALAQIDSFPTLVESKKELKLSVDGENVYTPEISVNSSGMAVVIWLARVGEVRQIKARRFNTETLSYSGSEIIAYDGSSGTPSEPKVSIDNDGQILTAWILKTGTMSKFLHYKIFNASNLEVHSASLGACPDVGFYSLDSNSLAQFVIGLKCPSKLRITTLTSFTGSSYFSIGDDSLRTNDIVSFDVSARNEGMPVVVWAETKSTDRTIYQIKAWYYDSSKNDWASEVLVTSDVLSYSDPKIARRKDGGFVLTYVESNQEKLTKRVFAAILNEKAKIKGEFFLLESSIDDVQKSPEVVLLSNDDALFSWSFQDKAGKDNLQIKYRQLSRLGYFRGPATLLKTPPSEHNYFPRLVSYRDSVLMLWVNLTSGFIRSIETPAP